MYRFKGFVTVDHLANNNANSVSAIGEISPYSLTFAKDVKHHASSCNAYTLLEFTSKDTEIGRITAPIGIVEKSIEIAAWIINRQTALLTVETLSEFKAALINQFQASCSNIDSGVMVQAGNGKNYPEYFTFSLSNHPTDNQNTIWLSDNSFKLNYDDYEIVIVPPITNLELFFGTYQTAVNEINRRTFIDSMDLIQATRNGYPETILTAEEYYFINPNNPSNRTKTNWTIMVYGPAGNDVDLIKDALIDYIQRNSTRTENQWKQIFPDIFKSTEFLIYPRWHNYAIEEMVIQAGIYSPVVNPIKEVNYLKDILPTFNPDHIENHTLIMGFPYKSIALSIISHFENRDDLFDLTDLYPDIINVSNTSLDFNRMSLITKGFLEKLATMIYVAESLDQYTELTSGYRRVERDGITYITVRYDNVRFMVSSKATTPDYQ